MEATLVVEPEALAARWAELCNDPESPDYFELNQYGEIVLSPRPSTRHQRFASRAVSQMQMQLGPEAVTEVGVLTDQGVRVPDAVWMPPERWKQANNATPLPFVPDICVEVLSPSNTRAEIEMKKGAYLRGGAREVVIVNIDASVAFFGTEGERAVSVFGLVFKLVPD
ncbi:MAG: Uma2 family endonuclease [Burkholderiales bacterium]